jgi:hypothetical protein
VGGVNGEQVVESRGRGVDIATAQVAEYLAQSARQSDEAGRIVIPELGEGGRIIGEDPHDSRHRLDR